MVLYNACIYAFYLRISLKVFSCFPLNKVIATIALVCSVRHDKIANIVNRHYNLWYLAARKQASYGNASSLFNSIHLFVFRITKQLCIFFCGLNFQFYFKSKTNRKMR